jgi:hypothetical protein
MPRALHPVNDSWLIRINFFKLLWPFPLGIIGHNGSYCSFIPQKLQHPEGNGLVHFLNWIDIWLRWLVSSLMPVHSLDGARAFPPRQWLSP